MQLVCPKCGRAVVGADLDLSRGLGVCRPCGELVPFPSALALGEAAPTVTPFNAAPARLFRPESYRLVEQIAGSRYEATITPNRLAAAPLLFFCLFWDTFMAVWYAIAIAGHIWAMALFGLLHLGVGLHLTHKAIAGLFNTRRLVIDADKVTWKSGPVPDRGNTQVPLELVAGFAVRESAGSKATTFKVGMNLADGTVRELEVEASDRPTAEYAASCFEEGLRLAKQSEPEGIYRG
ncbi:MAG TPA: hypothetical protein PLR99_21235 [Polyangiaceae bacterium]|nr:hypothetical protein [Polyangiaceae bacterium]